jgi:hypothetical protein
MQRDQYGNRCADVAGHRSTPMRCAMPASSNSAKVGKGEFDPDYQHWRSKHERGLDDDYRSWRQDQQRSFADEFNKWRAVCPYNADASCTGTVTPEDDRERPSSITGS